MVSENNKRVVQIDILKGIGIIMLLVGHLLWQEGSSIVNFVNSFHMPLFFFASGLLYKKRSLKETVYNKFFSLCLPLFLFSVLNLIPQIVFSLVKTEYNEQLLTIFRFQGLWFLKVLLIVSLTYAFIDVLIDKINNRIKKIIVPVVISLLFIFGLLISYLSGIDGSSSFVIALVGIGFYYVGVLSKRIVYLITQLKYSWVLGLLGLGLMIGLFFLKTDSDVLMYCSSYGNLLFFLLKSFIGIVASTLIAFSIPKFWPLEFLGKNSLSIMLVHFPIYLSIEALFSYLGKRTMLLQFPYSSLFILVVLVVSSFIASFVNKFLPIFSGKWRMEEPADNLKRPAIDNN